MRETVEKLALLNSLGREITSHLKLDRFVPMALKGVAHIVGSDLAILYLRQDNGLILKGVYPSDGEFEKVGAGVEKVGECLCGLAGAGEGIYSSDIQSDPRCVLNECKDAGIKSFAALPLIVQGEVLGVLSLASLDQRDFSGQSDFLETAALQIAVALQNALLYETMAKQVEDLKQSEERYQIVSGLTSDCAYAYRVAPDGQLTNDWVTGAFERISGYTKEEIRAQGGWKSLIYPDDLHIPVRQFEALFKDEATEVEYRIISKTGEIRWMRDYARPVMDEAQKKLQYIFGAVQDISEHKAAEAENAKLQEQLQQSQKMEAIGTLAGGIAHDFNNILSAVIGYTEMAMVEAEKDTPLYQNLAEVFRAGGRAKDLVKQILTFSRQNKLESQPVQIKLIAKEVIKFMRASLPATIKIQHDIRSDALIMADPTQVYQIILNLCTNAGHAMAENGGLLEIKLTDIRITADASGSCPGLKPGPYIQLIVRDTGHGIPKPILKRIFDPFFTTKETDVGTGMGLSVVHGIVGSYGGTISVTSEPEKGSTFIVYLPSIHQAVEDKPLAPEQIETGTEHILLVDDEEALVKIGEKILVSLGYEVTSRTSSLEALELFRDRRGKFDLVMTDMTMPDMAGDKLALEMIRINPEIPVILCSGFSSHIDEQQAFAMGIRAFVTKPILRSEIAGTVRSVLDKSKKAGPQIS